MGGGQPQGGAAPGMPNMNPYMGGMQANSALAQQMRSAMAPQPQTGYAGKGPSTLPPTAMPPVGAGSQQGNMPPGPLPPTGTYGPGGVYGGINGPSNPQALNDMYTNHPVLYALRQKMIAEGKLQPIGSGTGSGLLGG